jgi:CBS domain containing-hemolysin-like protein
MSIAGIAAIAGLAALVVCSALFSAAEAGITSINRTRARALRKSRDVRDRAVVALIDDRDAQ